MLQKSLIVIEILNVLFLTQGFVNLSINLSLSMLYLCFLFHPHLNNWLFNSSEKERKCPYLTYTLFITDLDKSSPGCVGGCFAEMGSWPLKLITLKIHFILTKGNNNNNHPPTTNTHTLIKLKNTQHIKTNNNKQNIKGKFLKLQKQQNLIKSLINKNERER